MPRLGQKKTRNVAAATLRQTSFADRLLEVLRDRGALLRLSVCGAAILALVVVVQGWKAPFTYRLGDYADHGITAKIEFHRVNQIETNRARADAEAAVPRIFDHNPQPLNRLPDQLRADLGAVVAASSAAEVPADIRAAFGLLNTTESESPSSPPKDVPPSFETLRGELVTEDPPGPDVIGVLATEFTQFLKPVKEKGLVAAAELSEAGVQPNQQIAVVSQESPNTTLMAALSEVQLAALLREGGLLGKRWLSYPALARIRPSLEHWISARAPATLQYNSAATQEAQRKARDAVEPRTDDFYQGQLLVPPGSTVDAQALAVLEAEYEQDEATVTFSARGARVVTVALLFAVLIGLNSYYIWFNEPVLVRRASRLSIFLAAIVLTVLLGRAMSFDPWRAEVIPLLATSMVLAIIFNPVLATLTGFSLALILTLSTVDNLSHFVILVSVTATAVIPLGSVASRSALIKVGFWTGAVYLIVSWGTLLIGSQTFSEVWTSTTLRQGLQGAGWCLVSAYLVAGSLPFIESAFDIVTDISLLEMSDVSHPLLQELVRRAPGTYNHSMAVATIGETAADGIGANGLMVRVGAYYHDIGKMLKPQYFVENMTEGSTSRHEHLAPAMSTLIIIGHVKDGVDLAHQHNLPQPLIDFIEQHHGTTLVEYFYREATRKAGAEPDHKTDAEESSFRYPGPKPQTREAGVLMLADAVESASRTLSDPTAKRIEGLVRQITMKRLLDGQFDESSLTLSEIRMIEESLTKSLIGIYHGRIKYPEQRTA